MATYGVGTAGFVPFTGYTNTLGIGTANNAAQAGAVQMNGLTQGDDKSPRCCGMAQRLWALLI